MSGTRNVLLAAFCSFARRSSNGSVVVNLSFDGVPRDTLGSCTSAILQYALRPNKESNAAVFNNAVIVRGLGGLVQPGLNSRSISFTSLPTFPSSARSPRHFPLGLLPNPACNLLPLIVFWQVAFDL